MESHLVPGDPILVENIVRYFKAMGIFDEFRHECLADVDTKSSCQNLSQRVDGITSKFLANETWHPDLNKNELRNKLRKHLDESGMLAIGANHVAEQVITPKVNTLFYPKIIEVVHQYLEKEREKLNTKQEITNSEKRSTETIPKSKTAVIDPIADILSFTSKPKPVASTSAQNAQSKMSETSKVEKKKEVSHQTKQPDPIPKPEKKKEEVVAKTQDALPKIKKEDIADQSSAVDNAMVSSEIVNPVKTEPIELPKELIKPLLPQTKSLDDNKEPEKVTKTVKMEECEPGFETPKKEGIKSEKKKVENLKLQIPDKLLQSEENIENKSSPSAKNSSSSKSKLDSGKHKSRKPLGLGVVKPPSKESDDGSSDKVSTDQSKILAKLPNVLTKDRPSLKNTISTTMVKCEKGGDSASKSKPKDTPTKTSDKSVSLKVGSIKKEDSSVKSKHSSEKHEKTKKPKISDSKSDVKIQSESSSSSDKTSKQSSHYSSSYDSSQGSDPGRSSSSVSSKEKPKHFSKHHRKEGSSADPSSSSSKKRPQSDSDSGTPKKDKKGSKHPTDEQKKSFAVQESAKITSRSDSIGSASSTSDSQTSLKEASISISSGDTSDGSSSKSSKKKKPALKDKEPCSSSSNLPPPSPPPPTSGLPAQQRAPSTEMSSMDESQESEFESSEDIGSESDEENSHSASSNQELSLKPTEIVSDKLSILSVFLSSSSSSEFEGFTSSPEKVQEKVMSDVSLCSVHTSELSNYEDDISDVECSPGGGKSKKRFSIKEAKEILKAKAEQQRMEASKSTPPKTTGNKKAAKSSPHNSATAAAIAEVEVSPPPEPKRESRRERKLNPKYASSEYASIFNDSRRTSFITKQSNLSETKAADAKKMEEEWLPPKHTLSTRRKSSATTADKSLPDDIGSKAAEGGKSSMSKPSASRMLEFSSEIISSDSPTKIISNAPDKKQNSLADTDSSNRIALKIKLSATKNDNETNKDPNVHGTKKEKKSSSKRASHRNSVNSSTLESIVNENKPFKNKSKHPAVALQENDKEVFHKQKVNNNGDVLNKIEHVRNNSHSKTNHISEKQLGE